LAAQEYSKNAANTVASNSVVRPSSFRIIILTTPQADQVFEQAIPFGL
jgi:hypothetical protein